MTIIEGDRPGLWLGRLHERVAELRERAIVPVALIMGALGLLLLGDLSDRLLAPREAVYASMFCFSVGAAAAIVQQRSKTLAAALLVAGLGVAIMAVYTWSGEGVLLCLLALPVALAALTINSGVGVVLALACTSVLLWAPSVAGRASAIARVCALVSIWGMLGLVWLTLGPLLTTLQWAWEEYERMRVLLEASRDRQQVLHETLEDLASANTQLARLQQLTLALRSVAEDARREKEQFVANVSHELRTPLNMVVGFCEMMSEAPETYGGSVPPALLADLDVVLRNGRHLSSLVDDVLDLSQIEAGQMALTLERCALAEIAAAAATAVRPLYQSKRLTLDLHVSSELPELLCDRLRIREVLLNLLSNAGRFTEQGGVTVCAHQDGSDLVVTVRDTGPGIEASRLGRLFEPFHQVDGSIRRRYGGTGLGLSISKGFVALHGGAMWAESEQERGSTFGFRLPIDPPVALDTDVMRWFRGDQAYEARTRPTRDPAKRGTAPRWVVLEEGRALQRLLSRYHHAVEVVPVQSLEDALRECEIAPGQALLVNDVDMPGAWERLQSASLPEGVPAIVCSVPGSDQAIQSLGIADYLVKPFGKDALLAALDRLDADIDTILLVEDELDALQMYARMLSSAGRGYRVLRARDGRQALDLLSHTSVDLVLLDLAMPNMDGFQFLSARRDSPTAANVPVVLISAHDPLGHPVVSGGVAALTSRGITAQQLLGALQALVRNLSLLPGPAESPEPMRHGVSAREAVE